MSEDDLYRVLGVRRDATENAIKKAYRKLARRYHPDFNPGDKQAEERFKKIAEAHDVLGDPEKRKIYDEFGEEEYDEDEDGEELNKTPRVRVTLAQRWETNYETLVRFYRYVPRMTGMQIMFDSQVLKMLVY